MLNRREFVRKTTIATSVMAMSARSYGQIIGSNSRVNFAVIGLRSRAYAHLASIKANNARAAITTVCDVDSRYLEKFTVDTTVKMGTSPRAEKDFRKVLASKDVDAITIATPDHWHAPMAILGMHADKHVYVEKPCSHNPQEWIAR